MNHNGKKRQFASNNKYPDCPPRMADGRHFTDYRPNTDINNMIKINNNLVNTFSYRNFLTDNAEKLMSLNDKMNCDRNCCGPCNNDKNFNIIDSLSKNSKYNFNKQNEARVSQLANKLMSNIANKQEHEPKPLDNSSDYCAFGLSSDRSNKACGKEFTN